MFTLESTPHTCSSGSRLVPTSQAQHTHTHTHALTHLYVRINTSTSCSVKAVHVSAPNFRVRCAVILQNYTLCNKGKAIYESIFVLFMMPRAVTAVASSFAFGVSSQSLTEKPAPPNNLFQEQVAPSRAHVFDEKDELSDVTLVVGDKRLYVHKTFLAVHSPVFRKMFFSDFKEKNCEEVPLPEKNYTAMISFLTQIYPGHSFRTITDESLVEILKLADEYQAEQVLSDCEQYMGTQIHVLGKQLSEDQTMLYLWMMAQYNLKRHLDMLMDLASKKAVHRLVKSKYFDSVPPETMNELLVRRCKDLEIISNRFND